jgi:uncharacterized protein
MKYSLFAFIIFMASATAWAGDVILGKTLPLVTIEKKGLMVPAYEIKNGRMVFKEGSEITYRKWSSSELTGKIRTVYHLAARNGIDEINQPYIDALIEANLPETLPDSSYKTLTILNTSDAFWGTAGIASGRFENSQKKFPYAYYVNDEEGIVQKAWGLKEHESAVIILDTEGRVIYFKEGKMSPEDIQNAVSLIKKKLAE